jgi:hypothetical protein
MEITALSRWLEATADSIAEPNHAGDLHAAAMLLRLMLALADVRGCRDGTDRWLERRAAAELTPSALQNPPASGSPGRQNFSHLRHAPLTPVIRTRDNAGQP